MEDNVYVGSCARCDFCGPELDTTQATVRHAHRELHNLMRSLVHMAIHRVVGNGKVLRLVGPQP